jgi:hypothetical protein
MIAGALVLAGCQSTTPAPPPAAAPAAPAGGEYVWLRTDGQRASGSATLMARFNADKRACIGDSQEVSDEDEACMRERGYIFVPASDAPRIAADLAARGGRR